MAFTYNAPPAAGAIGPRRPFTTLSFVPGTVLPATVNVVNMTFPVSGINTREFRSKLVRRGLYQRSTPFDSWFHVARELHLGEESFGRTRLISTSCCIASST
jgi:hypothetical protein